MSVTCIVLVASGAHSITIGLDALPERVNKSASSVESYVEQLENQFKCQFDYEVNNISDYIEGAAKQIRKDVDALSNTFRDFEKATANLDERDLNTKLTSLIHGGKADSGKVVTLVSHDF
ncbi:hypothetical protein COOONC_22526 [Cooperia oncophora]